MRLVADIGGTNARLALVDDRGEISAVRRYACSQFPGIDEVIDAYLDDSGMSCSQISEAAFCVAMPVTSDEIRMTNSAWSFSRSALQKARGWSRLHVINDFAAIALSLPHLAAADLLRLGDAMTVDVHAPMLVLGPGTGLGVALLVPAAGAWVPVSTEGGHITLSAHDDREGEILRLARQTGRHVSAERLLSGLGLPLLHRLVCEVDDLAFEELSASQIGDLAVSDSGHPAARTLDTFFAMLGSVAGNLALSTGARAGVYLGGGILPRIRDRLVDSRFRQRFVDKGRFVAYLSPVPTHLITHDNPALIGLAHSS